MKIGETWYLCASDYDGPVEIVDPEPVPCGEVELVLAQLDNGVVAAVRRDRLVEAEFCRAGWGHA